MKVQINKYKKPDYCSMTADVYIPHQVMCQKDISNDAKLIFGKIYSEIMSEITLNPIELFVEITTDELEISEHSDILPRLKRRGLPLAKQAVGSRSIVLMY